jgi:hypothetical protein
MASLATNFFGSTTTEPPVGIIALEHFNSKASSEMFFKTLLVQKIIPL